jgi:hypothetical protein
MSAALPKSIEMSFAMDVVQGNGMNLTFTMNWIVVLEEAGTICRTASLHCW